MTIGITGPRRRAPGGEAPWWRSSSLPSSSAICLILLGLTSDLLVDWLWFSAIGYLHVFWTTIGAKAEVFFAVFVATAIILWLNGLLASRFALPPWTQRPADFEWKPAGVATLPDLFGIHAPSAAVAPGHRQRRRPPRSAGRLRERSATGASSCGFSITCPMARTIRSTTRTSASISFRCQPMS